MDSAGLTSKDIAHRLLTPEPPWRAEVYFYGAPLQVPWNVLYFCLGYGELGSQRDG